MNEWYEEYWAQTWYGNTFLVRRPDQIAQAIKSNREWNNLSDSGCHFTCLAMIVGIDPARLASTLSSDKYFFADRSLPAKQVTGKTGGLVWDQNEPHSRQKSIVLKGIWHSRLRRSTSITIRFINKTSTKNYVEAKKLVAALHEKGRHVICGPEDHSLLIAGTIGDDFFVWDPDHANIPVKKILEGRITLRKMFSEFYKDQPIEIWEYERVMT